MLPIGQGVKKTPKPPKVCPIFLLTEEKKQTPIFFAILALVYAVTVVFAELCGAGVMSHSLCN